MNGIAAAIAAPIRAGASALASVGNGVAMGVSMLFQRGRSWGMYLARTRIDYKREVGDPASNSVVGAVVGWIARNFPDAPVGIRAEGSISDEAAIPPGLTGPGAMLRLLERPNHAFGGVLQWQATIVDYCCRGNAYWIKQRNASGRVIALWWIPERFLEPMWPENDSTVFIGWYEYRVNGTIYILDPRDVVHFRFGIDPNNTRKGLSPLASLFREIFTDDEASNFTASLLRNLGIPGVTISPTNTVTGRIQGFDPETVKSSFMEKFGGDKRGEPFVSSIPIEVKVMGFNPEQMQLRELRRIPEERISAGLGVPASVANLGAGLDQNAFTSYDVASRVAFTQGVIPLHRLIAAELEVQLLPEWVDLDRTPLDVFFDARQAAAMQEAAADVWKRHESAATKGLITRGAFKRATGQRATAADDVYIIPNNFRIVGAGGDPSAPGSRQIGPGAGPVALLEHVEPALIEAGPAEEPVAAVAGGPVRCSGCDKLLAEAATAPYRLACPRCKAVTEAELETVVAA